MNATIANKLTQYYLQKVGGSTMDSVSEVLDSAKSKGSEVLNSAGEKATAMANDGREMAGDVKREYNETKRNLEAGAIPAVKDGANGIGDALRRMGSGWSQGQKAIGEGLTDIYKQHPTASKVVMGGAAATGAAVVGALVYQKVQEIQERKKRQAEGYAV